MQPRVSEDMLVLTSKVLLGSHKFLHRATHGPGI
jgi:hypothetical protein